MSSRVVDQLTAAPRTRALALCQTRLAALCLHTGDPDGAEHWIERAGTNAADLRSARVNHALAAITDQPDAPPH